MYITAEKWDSVRLVKFDATYPSFCQVGFCMYTQVQEGNLYISNYIIIR